MTRQTKKVADNLRLAYDDERRYLIIMDKSEWPGAMIPYDLIDPLIVALGELRPSPPPNLAEIISRAHVEAVRVQVHRRDEQLAGVVALLGQAVEVLRQPLKPEAIADMKVWTGDDD